MSLVISELYKSFINSSRKLRLLKFCLGLLLLVFGFWTVSILGIPLDRLFGLFGRLGSMLANRIFPPDLVYATDWKILMSIIETIEMSILGALYGTIITIPLAWWASWNITPSRLILYPIARSIIVISRSFPVLILGFLLVAIFVYGPFAGVLALTIGTIGFSGKLMAEQAESIDMGPVEAMRATGAGPLKVFVIGIWPQVKPAWIGIMIYNWDARLRGSAILGFVSAGGIGLHLRLQISQLEYMLPLELLPLSCVGNHVETISHF